MFVSHPSDIHRSAPWLMLPAHNARCVNPTIDDCPVLGGCSIGLTNHAFGHLDGFLEGVQVIRRACGSDRGRSSADVAATRTSETDARQHRLAKSSPVRTTAIAGGERSARQQLPADTGIDPACSKSPPSSAVWSERQSRSWRSGGWALGLSGARCSGIVTIRERGTLASDPPSPIPDGFPLEASIRCWSAFAGGHRQHQSELPTSCAPHDLTPRPRTRHSQPTK
jgi:hypothetical protein